MRSRSGSRANRVSMTSKTMATGRVGTGGVLAAALARTTRRRPRGCLTLLGRDVAYRRDERRQLRPVPLQVHALGGRRPLGEREPGAPLAGRAYRPRHEAAAAVRADIVQHALDAVGAEGALVGADPRVGRPRRQVLVAVLAVGSELKHGPLLSRKHGIVSPARGRDPSRTRCWRQPRSTSEGAGHGLQRGPAYHPSVSLTLAIVRAARG